MHFLADDHGVGTVAATAADRLGEVGSEKSGLAGLAVQFARELAGAFPLGGWLAKYLAGEAGFDACQQAVMTHGGFGYAKEFHVERYLRESLIPRIAPISPQLVLCFIAERVLGLPKSY